MNMTKVSIRVLFGAFMMAAALSSQAAEKSSGTATVDREARTALDALYAKTPAAKALAPKAVGILVFPNIKKAGLIIGGQFGEGALIRGGKTVAYYSIAGGSWGLQAGVQKYSGAMFFMTENSLKQLDKADGFEIGVDPSVVLVDEGVAKSITTTSTQKEIYVFNFGQKGLMAGVSIAGNKISKIQPK
jgi:lipid-binding SYLF domain-containing protein